MEFKAKICVLYAKPYAMKDETTGQTRKGITCYYYNDVNFKFKDDGQGRLGDMPTKQTLPISLLDKVIKAPAVYEASMRMETKNLGNGNLSQMLIIDDLDYIDSETLVTFNKKGIK